MKAATGASIIPVIITIMVGKVTKVTSRSIITKKEKRDTTIKEAILDIITRTKATRSITIMTMAIMANITRVRKERRVMNSMRKGISRRAIARRDITTFTNSTSLRRIRNSSTNIMIMAITKNMVAIIMNMDIRKVGTLRKGIMTIIITKIITAKRVITRKDIIIMIIRVIKVMVDTMSTIIIIIIMARKVAMKTINTGDSRKGINMDMRRIIF